MNPLTVAAMMPDNADQIPGSLADWLARPDWRADALCKGETALYFSRRATQATAICQRCPVASHASTQRWRTLTSRACGAGSPRKSTAVEASGSVGHRAGR